MLEAAAAAVTRAKAPSALGLGRISSAHIRAISTPALLIVTREKIDATIIEKDPLIPPEDPTEEEATLEGEEIITDTMVPMMAVEEEEALTGVTETETIDDTKLIYVIDRRKDKKTPHAKMIRFFEIFFCLHCSHKPTHTRLESAIMHAVFLKA